MQTSYGVIKFAIIPSKLGNVADMVNNVKIQIPALKIPKISSCIFSSQFREEDGVKLRKGERKIFQNNKCFFLLTEKLGSIN